MTFVYRDSVGNSRTELEAVLPLGIDLNMEQDQTKATSTIRSRPTQINWKL